MFDLMTRVQELNMALNISKKHSEPTRVLDVIHERFIKRAHKVELSCASERKQVVSVVEDCNMVVEVRSHALKEVGPPSRSLCDSCGP